MNLMCLMPAISITDLMVTRCSIRESTSNIPRTVIAAVDETGNQPKVPELSGSAQKGKLLSAPF